MRTASPDLISDLLRAFSSFTWPAGRQAALDLAAACGWTVRIETRNAVRFTTNLGTNDDRARAFTMSDETTGELFDELTVHVTDADPDAPAALATAYTDLCALLETALGAPVSVEPGSLPRTFWDLDNGGRVGFQQLEHVVIMILLSRGAADLARKEARLGIGPDRIPGTGDENF